jgi:hypothetical protein
MKKTSYILISITLLASAAFSWRYYVNHYTFYDVVEDGNIYLNPFQDLQKDRDFYEFNLAHYWNKKDTINTQYFAHKLVSYRNSFNERQYEEPFSCANDYWSYKEKVLLEYSFAYNITNQFDSAASCLQPLLLGTTGHSNKGIKAFFKLQVAQKGRAAVIQEIKKGLNTTGMLDCYQCSEKYYLYIQNKIGISTIELALWKKEPEKLLNELLMEYGIEG